MIDAVDRLERAGGRLLALEDVLRGPALPSVPTAGTADPWELMEALLDLAGELGEDDRGVLGDAPRRGARTAAPPFPPGFDPFGPARAGSAGRRVSESSLADTGVRTRPDRRGSSGPHHPVGSPARSDPGTRNPPVPRRVLATDGAADSLPGAAADALDAHWFPAASSTGWSRSGSAGLDGRSAASGESTAGRTDGPASGPAAVSLATDAVALAAALAAELRPARPAAGNADADGDALSAADVAPHVRQTMVAGAASARLAPRRSRVAPVDPPVGRAPAEPWLAPDGLAAAASAPAPSERFVAAFAPPGSPAESPAGEFQPVGGPPPTAPPSDAPATTFPPIGADDLMDRLTTEFEFEFLRRYGRSGGGR